MTRSVQSSELSRNPKAVFKAAEDGPVTITRRDGDSLILTRESQVRSDRLGLEIAASLVAASLAPEEDGPFVRRLRVHFPWVTFLSETDQDEFAREVVDVARSCAAVSRFDRLLITLSAWKDTAEAIAAGYTYGDDLDWSITDTTVPDPRA